MASWTDLAGGEEVAVGGVKLTVCGIGIDGLNLLVQRFPEFIDMILGQRVEVSVILRDFPKAVIVAFAAGIGEPGNEECEKRLGRLPLIDQVTLLEAIIRQTVGGDDPGPFVERLKGVAKRLGYSQERLDDMTQSSPPSATQPNGRAVEAAESGISQPN